MNQKEAIQSKCGELKDIFVGRGIGNQEAKNFRTFESCYQLYETGTAVAGLFKNWSDLCAEKAARFRKEKYAAAIAGLAGDIERIARQAGGKTAAEIGESCQRLAFISQYLEKFIKKLEDFAEVLRSDLAGGRNLEALAVQRLSELRKLASEMEAIGKKGDRTQENILSAAGKLG